MLIVSVPASCETATPAKPKSTTHVYLLRGFMNVFSLGLDSMMEKLQNRGIHATVNNHLLWPVLAEEAIENCKSGRESNVILIGHSLGASAVVSMADRLNQAGVRVPLVVTLDPVVRTTVGGNVGKLLNYYLSNEIGTSVDRGTDFHGSLQNMDMRTHSELGHVSLTTSEAIQQQVIAQVVAATHSSCHVGA